MNLSELIKEIQGLEHFRTSACVSCGEPVRYHTLQIYAECLHCSTKTRVRAFGGIGTEIQDIVDAVLEWAGKDDELDAVIRRYHKIKLDR
jgi:hypothetical protein